MEGFVGVVFVSGNPDRARLERAHARRDDHRLALELGSCAGLDEKCVIVLAPDDLYLLAEMHAGVERLDLLEQCVGQFFARAFRDGRDVVDGLVRIELGALPARLTNRIDDLGLEAEEPEFEYLEQAAGARSDNDDVSIDHVRDSSGMGRALSRL